MRTDPELIRRLAHEIDARFRGAKVRDAGLMDDGRFAILIWSRGAGHLLAFDVFGPTPMVTLEDGELAIGAEPGFVRAAAVGLRGTTLLRSQSRTGDRLLRLTFGSKSRFGVGDEVDVYAELVPRFGNLILAKNNTIVAAVKEFSLAENATRAIQIGGPYSLPPLVARARTDASSVDEGVSVLDALKAERDTRVGAGVVARTNDRRRILLKRLDERERKFRDELAKVEAKRAKADAREALRTQGEEIFGTLHELDSALRDEAKDAAAKLFAQYKKLGASIPHLEERRETIARALASIEELRWEAERTDDVDFADVERAAAVLDPRQTLRQAQGDRVVRKKKKRAPLEFRTEGGSRILVGRSPTENAELTFHVARPNDLWFHAQNIPGAHVILQRDDRGQPSDDDVTRAASLAAFYSKAKSSAKVAVDYTERKHVRAQKDAAPGLVWYTNPRTILVSPKEGAGDGGTKADA